MMLVGRGLRVALATTHLPLSQVPGAITTENLLRTLQVLDADLRGVSASSGAHSRRRAQPHSGESGHLGREDIEVIAPAIAAARTRASRARPDSGTRCSCRSG